MKKQIAAILFLITCILFSYSSIAALNPWDCPKCGITGNTGNYCGNCGEAAPNPTPSIWNCVCGTRENTGNYCPVCGLARPGYNNPTQLASYTPNGNGESSTIFKVQSDGNATIVLKQKSGKCIVQAYKVETNKIHISWCGNVPPINATAQVPNNVYEKEMYGKYHLRIIEPNGNVYESNWTDQHHLRITDSNGNVYESDWTDPDGNMEYILSLPYRGVYRITVTPYSEKEMNASWDNMQNLSWISYPEWEVADTRNCECVE